MALDGTIALWIAGTFVAGGVGAWIGHDGAHQTVDRARDLADVAFNIVLSFIAVYGLVAGWLADLIAPNGAHTGHVILAGGLLACVPWVYALL